MEEKKDEIEGLEKARVGVFIEKVNRLGARALGGHKGAGLTTAKPAN